MQRSLGSELEIWSRWNAAALLVAGAASIGTERSWLLAPAAAISWLVLLARTRGRYTPAGAFGTANAVTSLRVALILTLPFEPARALAPTMLAILALDGLDGVVARRSGTASVFGAHFDMESDALFVAVAALEAWTRHRLGAWVLLAGGLRYAYVVCLWLKPSDRGEQPRSLLGRLAFLVLVLGLAGAWLVPGPIGTALAAVGCGAVTASFLRSFAHAYGSR